jgi:hypothetical protein
MFNMKQPGAAFVEFHGATMDFEDGKLIDIVEREPIVINVSRIDGYYDHTILVAGRKVRVMETKEDITRKLKGW